MNRRGFLRLFGAGAAGMVLDPEMLLWRPGAKTIFLPSAEVFQPDTFVTLDWISREALRILVNELDMAKTFNRERFHRRYFEAA